MKRVLIVEDYMLLRMSITFMLSHEDTAVTSCDNFESAQGALADHAFDLVITDLRLSSAGDGLEGMRLLQAAKKKDPAIQVIIMTATGTAETEEIAYRLGALHYFEKPFDIGLLAQKVQALGISTRRSFLADKMPYADERQASRKTGGLQPAEA